MTTFNELPAELRLKIYGFLLPNPKIKYVTLDSISNTLRLHHELPTIMHINQESRHEALRSLLYFSPKSVTKDEPEGFPNGSSKMITAPQPELSAAFCFHREDTLLLSHQAATSLFNRTHALHVVIPHIALDIGIFRVLMGFTRKLFLTTLKDMRCEHLDILAGPGPKAEDMVGSGQDIEIIAGQSTHYKERVEEEWKLLDIVGQIPSVRIARVRKYRWSKHMLREADDESSQPAA